MKISVNSLRQMIKQVINEGARIPGASVQDYPSLAMEMTQLHADIEAAGGILHRRYEMPAKLPSFLELICKQMFESRLKNLNYLEVEILDFSKALNRYTSLSPQRLHFAIRGYTKGMTDLRYVKKVGNISGEYSGYFKFSMPAGKTSDDSLTYDLFINIPTRDSDEPRLDESFESAYIYSVLVAIFGNDPGANIVPYDFDKKPVRTGANLDDFGEVESYNTEYQDID